MTITGPDAPEDVVAAAESGTVQLSWQAVDEADRYTITFTQVQGANQEGPCPTGSHTTSLTVNAPSTNATLAIGGAGVPDMLRAYTTYEVTVVAVSDVLGTSPPSQFRRALTPQIG